MKSVSIGWLVSEMLTRRTATVTISAPEASTAAAFSSRLLYLPVPTISREVKVRPATVQVSDCTEWGAFTQPPPTNRTISNASPSATRTSPSVARGTISRLRSTATLRRSSPSSSSIAATEIPPDTCRGSPLTLITKVGLSLIARRDRRAAPQAQTRLSRLHQLKDEHGRSEEGRHPQRRQRDAHRSWPGALARRGAHRERADRDRGRGRRPANPSAASARIQFRRERDACGGRRRAGSCGCTSCRTCGRGGNLRRDRQVADG